MKPMSERVAAFAVPPVVKSVTVRCPPEKAFRLFTADLARWWPLAGFHAAPDPESCRFEGFTGGRIYERSAAGGETVWGRVEAWEPPHRVAFSWAVWLSEDPCQHVSVAFTPVEAGTRVELTHQGWEHLGDRAATVRESYNQGWVTVFEQCYGGYANSN
jgi:uncharacterized protein YndB with AHSA1/START domain